MRKAVVAFILGASLSGGAAFWGFKHGSPDTSGKTVASTILHTQKEEKFLGHAAYATYLEDGKKALSGQSKFLAAKVVRDEGLTHVVKRVVGPVSSSATVAIWYAAEYSYGFDLHSGAYDVKAIDGGVEITVGPPRLVASPAVSNLRHKILDAGLWTDEKEVIIALQQEVAVLVKKKGEMMAGEAAIQALCEKKLIEFFYEFLSRQPGVTALPRVTVKYRQGGGA